VDAQNQSRALLSTLTIYNGAGIAQGNASTVVGTSSTTSTTAVTGYVNPVTWTFAGGLQIIDTSTYTAGFPEGNGLALLVSSLNPYPNGTLTQELFLLPGFDLAFQGTFSPVTPVPFEFSPALGVVGLGALWVGKKFLLKK
jgi:hypothetical protein